ncbi:hypothetical protein ABEX25_11640 [Paenibacillus thiaminolyticus]|uniref:hypothetical protein n=1 Tax=Paenibacillus thiaminolyticus TaxID=49283 RepID=UPI003D2D2FDE
MSNNKYDASEKLIVLDEIASGEIGIKDAAKKYGVGKTTFGEMASSLQGVWL